MRTLSKSNRFRTRKLQNASRGYVIILKFSRSKTIGFSQSSHREMSRRVLFFTWSGSIVVHFSDVINSSLLFIAYNILHPRTICNQDKRIRGRTSARWQRVTRMMGIYATTQPYKPPSTSMPMENLASRRKNLLTYHLLVWEHSPGVENRSASRQIAEIQYKIFTITRPASELLAPALLWQRLQYLPIGRYFMYYNYSVFNW